MRQITDGKPRCTGFETTSGITFRNYTCTPIPLLQLPEPPKMSQDERDAIDWSLSFNVPRARLSHGGSVITNEDVEAVRDGLDPAAHLDLSKLAAVGLLPTPYIKSFPDIDQDLRPCTAPIEIKHEKIVDSIHDAFYRTILPNIYYAYRIRQFFRLWGILQVHPDNETDLVPHLTDDEARALLVKLDAQALRKAEGSGPVLFMHIPYWVMPEEDVLQEIHSIRQQGSMTAPRWFPSVHAACEAYGAHHFVVYTGELAIIGVFNADFTDISFANPERVDVGRNGYGTGIGPDGLERMPLEGQRICLVQVTSQLMMDATESLGTTAPQAATPLASAFKFNTTPLAQNEQPAGLSNEPSEAMRFSRRIARPNQQGMDVALKAYLENKMKKGKGKAVVTAAQESALALSAQPLASGSQPTAPGSPSRKRQRSDEQLRQPALPQPIAERRPAAPAPRRAIRPVSAARPAAGSAIRHISAEKTKHLDAQLVEDFRPAKRTRLAITEGAVSPPTPPAPAELTAGPSGPRGSARSAKLAEVENAKKRSEIKEKAKAISSRSKRQVAQAAAPVATPSTSRQITAWNVKLSKAANAKKRQEIKGRGKARSERRAIPDKAVGDVDVNEQEQEHGSEPIVAMFGGERYPRRIRAKVTAEKDEATVSTTQRTSSGKSLRKVAKSGAGRKAPIAAASKAKQLRVKPEPRLPTRRSKRIPLMQ
ncbi:hypothetical protein FRB94_012656 [Tulasnella sp. JGI-2019a]|nr:hypothetical protein FRB94_012656 [Tulasnella sp. JGI-2019a]